MTEAPKVQSPTILHEQNGLRIAENPKNGFCVVTLYYFADPSKRSAEWEAEARAGMSEAKWRKEYLIDYKAMFGEKVFPEISTNRDRIVVRDPFPEIPRSEPCWGGLDYGSRNPSSFHVYTILDGVVYSIWELYEPCRSIPVFAEKLRACPYWDQIKYIAADRSIWYDTQQLREGALTSIYDLFVRERIHKLVKGIDDEQAWIAHVRDLWQNAEDPRFRIFACCPNQIREFEEATYSTLSDRAALTQNYKETIVDHENHSLDDCKYFMNSRPRYKPRTLTLPNLVKSYVVKR